jgi:hypothetical protein
MKNENTSVKYYESLSKIFLNVNEYVCEREQGIQDFM